MLHFTCMYSKTTSSQMKLTFKPIPEMNIPSSCSPAAADQQDLQRPVAVEGDGSLAIVTPECLASQSRQEGGVSADPGATPVQEQNGVDTDGGTGEVNDGGTDEVNGGGADGVTGEVNGGGADGGTGEVTGGGADGGTGGEESDDVGTDEETDSDEIDFAFFDEKWNPNLSLLEYCRDKVLKLDFLKKTLQSLKDKDMLVSSLDIIDKHGYAAIHYLITKKNTQRPRLLEVLIINGADIDLTTTCRGGLTAIHLAVEAEDLDCVRTLISLEANVNIADRMGKTPLDFINIKKRLAYSSDKDIQLKKIGGKSPSMASPEKRVKLRIDAIIKALESVGASKGNSLLEKQHSTLSTDSSSSLLQFNDPDSTISPNMRKINTKHYRDTHDRIWRVIREEEGQEERRGGRHGGRRWGGRQHMSAEELVKLMKTQEKYRRTCGSRILCLDGGGIRGLLQMSVLLEIERQMGGRKIVDLFDWIVGTSTGGIIALSLTYGPPNEDRKSVRQLRDTYWNMKGDIFGACQEGLLGFLAKGNTEKLEETLQCWLGKEVTLDQQTYPKVLIPAVCKKDSNLSLHFFNNCFEDEYSKEVVWKVGRYTSAAPFYFTEIDNYIDGGMLANDPSEVALTAIQDFYHNRGEKIPISLLVSVGSGVNPALPLGKIDIKSNLLNPKAYLDLMEVLESSVVGKQTASGCQNRCREQGIEYFRFDPVLSERVDSNQHKSQVLRNMITTTRQYLRKGTVKQDMDRLVCLLNKSELTST